MDPALVGLVHSDLRDNLRVVLAQFLFSYSQYRNTHYYSWDQRDRLDVADNYPGMVDQKWLAQISPHGRLYLAHSCSSIGG